MAISRVCRYSRCSNVFVLGKGGGQMFCCPECKAAHHAENPVDYSKYRAQQIRSLAAKKKRKRPGSVEDEKAVACSEIRWVIRRVLDMGDSGPCVSLRGRPEFEELVRKYERERNHFTGGFLLCC